MQQNFRWTRVLSVVALAVVAAGIIGWQAGLLPSFNSQRPQNALLVIAPYQYNGTWVFDDQRVGLVREPFVAGVPEMIDVLVEDIPTASDGFRLTFSAQPFPGYEKKLTWLRGDSGGNWYRLADPPMEGWICPAMFHYYDKAPKELYVKADPRDR